MWKGGSGWGESPAEAHTRPAKRRILCSLNPYPRTLLPNPEPDGSREPQHGPARRLPRARSLPKPGAMPSFALGLRIFSFVRF